MSFFFESGRYKLNILCIFSFYTFQLVSKLVLKEFQN